VNGESCGGKYFERLCSVHLPLSGNEWIFQISLFSQGKMTYTMCTEKTTGKGKVKKVQSTAHQVLCDVHNCIVIHYGLCITVISRP
jgi:hypothetical protein